MICGKCVRFWMARRGLHYREVGKQIGMSAASLSRVLRAKQPTLRTDKQEALAKLLGVHVEALTTSGDPTWRHFYWWQQNEEVRVYQREIADAESVFTITQGMDCYLVQPELVDWTGRVWLHTEGWSEYTRILDEYIRRQRTDYEGSVHSVVCSEAWLTQATKNVPGACEAFRSMLHDRCEITALGIVSDWKGFQVAISETSPVLFGGWDKITFIDDRICIVRPDRRSYAVTEHYPTVRTLRLTLEWISQCSVRYSFPVGKSATPEALRQSSRYARKVIDRALRVA